MIRMLVRLITAASLALYGTAGFAAAQGVFVGPPPGIGTSQALTGNRGRVARELSYFGFGGIDVSGLSNGTIALLDNALHSDRSHGDKASRLRSILRGGGILQRAIENAGRRF